MSSTGSLPVAIFSTAPQSAHVEPQDYYRQAADVARWSEEAGCFGILIYTDNRLIDPWLVAQIVIQNTENLHPLVATQPVYMHPYTVAKMIASYAYLYERRIFLNMVAGGFRNDLLAMGDPTPHDDRYVRMQEYTQIILDLCAGESVTLDGKFYQVKNLSLTPAVPEHLRPGVLLSGSSPAGRATAAALGATAVEYPKPGHEYDVATAAERRGSGIRVGIVTDGDDSVAWDMANRRFPPDRKGQITHKLAMKTSDSQWHKQLSELDAEAEVDGHRSPYWLWPFKNYSTFCPYLVGDHEIVSTELARYISAGFETFILDIPATKDDLDRAGEVFRRAVEKTQ